MKTTNFSPTYTKILDLLFKTEVMKISVDEITMENGRFQRAKTGHSSHHLSQDFYMAASELWSICTPHEWYLIGRISAELKSYNALWHCDPAIKNNSSNFKAIKGLIEKNVLIRTETTDIYLVNPVYVRRGDFLSVLNTTASLLADTSRVEPKHITDKRAVRQYTPIVHQLPPPDKD